MVTFSLKTGQFQQVDIQWRKTILLDMRLRSYYKQAVSSQGEVVLLRVQPKVV